MKVLIALVALVVGACSSAVTPTPQVIYVTPAPVAEATVTAPPAPTSAPTEAPTPVPTDPPPAVPSLVPLGTWATIGDWKIRFTKVDWDAWPEIKATNQFNDPPPTGYTLVMPWLEYEYIGSDRVELDPMGGFYVVGSGGVEYDQFSDPSCGVLPDPDVAMNNPTLRNGGKAAGWICFAVQSSDVASLIAFSEFMFDFTGDSYAEFALRE